MPARDEELIQRALIEHLHYFAADDVIYYHCPNGMARSKSEGGRLKAMGVLAGVPDICLVLPDGRAAFLEMKQRKGSTSPAQDAFAIRCERIGVAFHVAYSLDSALDWLRAIGALKPEAS